MGFPFLAPLKDWVVKEFENREGNQIPQTLTMPYAILSSGALVVKKPAESETDKRIEIAKSIIEKGSIDGGVVYKGCVVANNINIFDNYQLNETIIGYDFSGNPIKVEGEKGRKVSVPIIESIEIDTDGANNTLKTARVNIRCFTLKQLEMFELFFLKPGMNLLLEYGNSYLLRNKVDTTPKPDITKEGENVQATPFSRPEECLLPKSSYDEFVKNFSNFFRPDQKGIGEYQLRLKRSLGTYDYVAGKVTNFTYTIEQDSTYNINLEISQANQITLAIPKNPTGNDKSTPPTNGGKNKQPSPTTIREWQEQIISDLNLNTDVFKNSLTNVKNIEKEFWNWGKLNEKADDELVSNKWYLSFRFILKVLVQYGVENTTNFFEIPITTYKESPTGSPIEAVIVMSNNKLISSDENVIFPRKSLPKIISNLDKKILDISEKEFVDGRINGYDFDIGKSLYLEYLSNPSKAIELDANNSMVYGNALNAFILYDEVVRAWKTSYTKIDFLEKILAILNDNSYGLFDIRYASPRDGVKASLIDYKMKDDAIAADIKSKPIYRFKPTTINSIVKDFQFTMELSNLVAGRTIFNSHRLIAKSLEEAEKSTDKDKDSKFSQILERNLYESVDYSQYSTYDGYYSINKIDVEAIKSQNLKYSSFENKEIATVGEKKETTATDDGKGLEDLIKSKTVLFREKDKKDAIKLIYKDSDFIVDKIIKTNQNAKKTKSILTPIEVNITIDGFSGLNCGEYFHIDGVPETYNRDGVFQITNVKQSISDNIWNTAIEAGWRIIN